MNQLKWRRTSKKEPFELNGAEAVSNKFDGRNGPKLILYQICQYKIEDNKGHMCKNCKTSLTVFVGMEDCIYNAEKSIHLGFIDTIKNAKILFQRFEDKLWNS